jgi:hypothetical protein
MWQLQWEKLFKDEWNKMIGVGLKPTYHAAWAATKKVAQTGRGCPRGKGVASCRKTMRAKRRVAFYSVLEHKYAKRLDLYRGK